MTDTRSITRWMRANVRNYVDPIAGEVNMTGMVEAWDRENGGTGCTLDSDHPAWDCAAMFAP